AGGSTVSGVVSVTASASGDGGITKVELYADGLLVGEMNPSWSLSWNTLAAALPAYDGPHTLTTKAYDSHGQTATSAPVIVTVNNRGSSWYHADITTMNTFPAEMQYDPVNQQQYGFDITV